MIKRKLEILALSCEINDGPTVSGTCQCSASDWSPVCGQDGLTYINKCKAECEKTHVLCEGNCPCQDSGAGIDDQEYADPQENFDQDQEFDAKVEV